MRETAKIRKMLKDIYSSINSGRDSRRMECIQRVLEWVVDRTFSDIKITTYFPEESQVHGRPALRTDYRRGMRDRPDVETMMKNVKNDLRCLYSNDLLLVCDVLAWVLDANISDDNITKYFPED